MTPADYARARRLLMRRDPMLATLIRGRGPCGLAAAQGKDPLAALIRAIINQQLSNKAAATIYRRFLALFGDGAVPPPAQVLAASDAALRSVGLSRQKVGYLRDLCARVLDGRLDFGSLDRLEDEAVIEALTAVKGIGRWSAEMFLMFVLERLDVFPAGDAGIVRAVRRVYRLRKPPSPPRLRAIAEPWRPYRSVACWYLWQSLDNVP